MEKLRTIETRLATMTLVGLAVYAPLETIASWQMFGGLRMSFVQRGDHLFYGSPEMIVVAAGAAITVGMFGVSLFLTYRAESAFPSQGGNG